MLRDIYGPHGSKSHASSRVLRQPKLDKTSDVLSFQHWIRTNLCPFGLLHGSSSLVNLQRLVPRTQGETSTCATVPPNAWKMWEA